MSSAPSTYRVDFEANAIYECGAILLALLAYPKDDPHSANAFGSLCAFALRSQYENTPEGNAPQLMKPVYAFRDKKLIDRGLKALQRISNDRMVAAKMAIAPLKALLQGSEFQPPEGLERLSLNRLSEFVLSDARQSDPGNVESRIWRQSKPVIHLAVAIAVVMDQYEGAGQHVDFRHVLADRKIAQIIAEQALLCELLIPCCKELRISRDELIKVRSWAD